MEFHEAANFLFALRRFRMHPGTDSTAELLAHLGDPHEGVEYVQIAGSNGKGSTARMLETVLRGAGMDVGLYTSPHMEDARERVRVNDRRIPEAALVEFAESIREYVIERAADGEAPTYFEAMTAMALWHFGREGVDVAVLEVGIGGRHDATSVVDPVAGAVTSVTLEHTAVLGDTIEEIARDKAQVAPRDRPLVTAATGEALDAIRDEVEDVLVVSDGADGDVAVEYGGVVDGREAAVTVEAPDWAVETRLPLLGEHQARNAGVAAALARGFDVGEGTIARGLRRADWPGRFEITGREPLVVLDGAHNPGACEALADTLDEFEYDDLTLVFGAMHDKDHGAMAGALPEPDSVVACRPDVDRAADRAVIERVFERRGVGTVETADAVETAVDRAVGDADADDCVLVTGSLYTVAEARTRWSRTAVPKRIRDVADAREVLSRAHVPGDVAARAAAGGVHRVMGIRVRPRQARALVEETRSLGGTAAVSGVDGRNGERLDVVLSGTLAQFERLAGALDGRARGLPAVADDLREALSTGTGTGTGLDSGGREPREGYPWGDRTAVMGILNVTPDSFHDAGEHFGTDAAVARAEEMVAAGADIVDVGGESTRPGADPVSAEEEIERVRPVVERIADLDATVSVDTRKADVARAALDAGAGLVNDVSGLEDPEMRFVAADRDVPLVVMHSIDTPVVEGKRVAYDDVVGDVIAELRERVLLAEKAGLDRSQVVVDPGLGFGKTAAESFELLGRVDELAALGCPVLVGHSHKSMFGAIDRYPDEGGYATVGATALAVERGVDVVRVHDVAENVAAVRAVEMANGGRAGGDG